MTFHGNDPTGYYQGKYQFKPKRRRRKRREIVQSLRTAERREDHFSVDTAYHAKSNDKAVGNQIHLSQVPSKPDYAAWRAAQVSNDFWSRVKPTGETVRTK